MSWICTFTLQYVSLHLHAYVYICISTFTLAYVRLHWHTYVHTCIYTFTLTEHNDLAITRSYPTPTILLWKGHNELHGVFTLACIRLHWHIYVYTCIYTFTLAYMRLHLQRYVYTNITQGLSHHKELSNTQDFVIFGAQWAVYVHLHLHAYVYNNTYAFTPTHIRLHLHAYIYTCIHTFTLTKHNDLANTTSYPTPTIFNIKGPSLLHTYVYTCRHAFTLTHIRLHLQNTTT